MKDSYSVVFPAGFFYIAVITYNFAIVFIISFKVKVIVEDLIDAPGSESAEDDDGITETPETAVKSMDRRRSGKSGCTAYETVVQPCRAQILIKKIFFFDRHIHQFFKISPLEFNIVPPAVFYKRGF
jgi:hypothetical protein